MRAAEKGGKGKVRAGEVSRVPVQIHGAHRHRRFAATGVPLRLFLPRGGTNNGKHAHTYFYRWALLSPSAGCDCFLRSLHGAPLEKTIPEAGIFVYLGAAMRMTDER